MREEYLHSCHENRVQTLPSNNASIDNTVNLSAPTPGPAMASRTKNGGDGYGQGKRKQRSMRLNTRTALLSILATVPAAMAENCISLTGSTQCPGFSSSSISTDSTLVGLLYVPHDFSLRWRRLSTDTKLLAPFCNTFRALRRLTNNCARMSLQATCNRSMSLITSPTLPQHS